jgi:alpha-glucosidase
MRTAPTLLALAALAAAQKNYTQLTPAQVDARCPGYAASNVRSAGASLTADLALAGPACDVYGPDVRTLRLSVQYETGARGRSINGALY